MKRINERVNIRAVQIRMLVAYVLLSFFSIYTISTLIINFSSDVLANKVSNLISANCQQIELNTNNYLNTVETITTLLFADEKYYKYNPVKDEYDEYTRIKNDEAIADRIADLGLMQNFSDFAVVYSNGNRVGWTSNTTAALFDAEELYKELKSSINNTRTQDGWIFGIGDVTDRLYYVKQLNDDAIIMTSFYSRELENAFEYPTELEGMVINLVDENNTILYSSEPDNIASVLDEEIAGIIEGKASDNYIANANSCENGWSVVCAMPTSYILGETNQIKNSALVMAWIVVAIMIAIGLAFLSHMFKPVDSVVEELQEEAVTDMLSGLFNKQSFNAEVSRRLSGLRPEATRTFVMIDVDNFKLVNDNLGHAYGDEFIVRMGKLVSEQFDEGYTVGRVGGDEFAIYTEKDNENVEEETAAIVNSIKDLFAAFDKEFFEDKTRVNVSLSIGIAVLTGERRFDNLYKAADEALYISKKSGKNRYTIYDAGEVK